MNGLEIFNSAPEKSKLSLVDYVRKYWFWIALICITILLLPFFTPAAYFLWGIGSAKSLFRDQLGIGESISTVFAVAFMFVYTLAIPNAARWLTHGRKNPKDIAIAFVSVLFVFASKPLLAGLLESSFNAQTGMAQKCYSWNGATLKLSERGDSGCGIDPVTGQQTAEMTPEIASILGRQQHAPKKIAINGTTIQFFDPTSGRPIVWYGRAPDGTYELFDAEGFNPRNGERLEPVSPNIINMINKQMKRMPTTIGENTASEARIHEVRTDPVTIKYIPIATQRPVLTPLPKAHEQIKCTMYIGQGSVRTFHNCSNKMGEAQWHEWAYSGTGRCKIDVKESRVRNGDVFPNCSPDEAAAEFNRR